MICDIAFETVNRGECKTSPLKHGCSDGDWSSDYDDIIAGKSCTCAIRNEIIDAAIIEPVQEASLKDR